MKSTINKINPCQLEIAVELSKEDLDGYISKAEEELGSDLSIDGFRKGKAPKDLIRDKIGAQKILEAGMEIALKDSLSKVVKEHSLDVLNVSNLKVKENSREKMAYQIEVAIYPAISMSDFSGLKVEPKRITVEQKEIDDTLETIKSSRATFLDKDGIAVIGDRVEVDFEVTTDGKVIEGGVSKNHPLILGGKNFIPGFEEALVGTKKDEEKSFSLTAPADYYRKEIAGKKLDFKVKINNVQTVSMPELNDEFASKVGKFENVNQLMENIKDGLMAEKKAKEKQRVRLEILNHIIGKSSFDVPEIIINQQLDGMVQNFERDLQNNGLEMNLYLSHIGKTQDDLRKDWGSEAEKQAKISLIIHEIAKKEKISAEPEEIELAMNNVIQDAITKGQVEKSDLDLDFIRETIKSRIVNEKTLEFLEKACAA